MITLDRNTFLGSNKRVFNFRDITVTETEYHAPVSEDWHCHEFNHITLFLDGGNCEQRATGDIQVAPGRILNYPSGIRHRNRHTLFPSRNINIEIHDRFLRENALTLPDYFKRTVLPEVLDIYDECVHASPHAEESIHALVVTLLGANRSAEAVPPRWLEDIIAMIHDHWNENLSLSQLSSATGVHPVTISKSFGKFFGTTLGKYTREMKVNKALQLARTTAMPLVQVAMECGFFDQSHFIKAFRSVTGRSPKHWTRL